jgi:N-acetylmuramoyl-L-alanine amidase
VLHKAFMPSVLTELGFISNKEEGKFLNSEEGQNKIADAIALAIINYKNGYIGNATLFAEKEVVKSKTSDNKFEKKDTNSKKQSHDSKVNKKEKKNVQENIVVEENIESVLDKGNKQLTYKIQIATGAKKIKPIPSNFKGLDSISISEEQMKFKYYYGETVDYEEAKLLLKRARKVGYKSSFIITLNQ